MSWIGQRVYNKFKTVIGYRFLRFSARAQPAVTAPELALHGEDNLSIHQDDCDKSSPLINSFTWRPLKCPPLLRGFPNGRLDWCENYKYWAAPRFFSNKSVTFMTCSRRVYLQFGFIRILFVNQSCIHLQALVGQWGKLSFTVANTIILQPESDWACVGYS